MFAVAVTEAMPAALTTAVELDNTALGPLGGTVNVIVAPLAGLPNKSNAVICKGGENAVPTTADWFVPAAIGTKPGKPAPTVMAPEVPVIKLLTSLAVTVCTPAVVRVTKEMPKPLIKVKFGGRSARGSELVICTVPV